ncbi:ATP-binding protein [Kitasatospora sp. NPDC048365]|uniref:ATP-binding protein n=1 Tax=Kitasatospora sp. NPDC048365 TaxID=3364050 RepID=UPI0037230054
MKAAGHWHVALAAEGGRALEPGMTLVRRVLEEVPRDGATEPGWRDDVLLVAAELMSNACRHTPGPTRLDIDLDAGVLAIAVTDRAAAPPIVRPWQPDRPHGHGLHIIGRIAIAWGVSPAPGGKTVWAALPAPRGSAG